MVPLRKGAHFESRTYVLQCLCEYCHSKDFIFAYSMLTLTERRYRAWPTPVTTSLCSTAMTNLPIRVPLPHHLCFPPPFDLYSVLYYIFAAPTILLHPTAAGHHLCCISTPSFVLHPSHFRYSSTIYPLVVAITRLSLEVFALLYEQIFPSKAWFLWGKHNGKYSEQCRDLQKER